MFAILHSSFLTGNQEADSHCTSRGIMLENTLGSSLRNLQIIVMNKCLWIVCSLNQKLCWGFFSPYVLK